MSWRRSSPGDKRVTPKYAVLDAPSILGLRPAGVERLPDALRAYQDREEAAVEGSQDVRESGMLAMELARVREMAAVEAAEAADRALEGPERRGFWVHLDVDVLDDAVVPAVTGCRTI